MIINSDFHDYYDTALAHGVDKGCVYNRYVKYVEVPDILRKLPMHRANGGEIEKSGFWVGFCGKLYYGVYFNEWTRFGYRKNYIVYGADLWKVEKEKKQPYWFQDNHNDAVAAEEKDWTDLFLELDTPIFVVRRRYEKELILNQQLQDYNFMQVFDSYSANQAIQQFLMNEMAREKEIDTPADKYRIKMHGFDDRSFKREPGGPTRKRKKLK